MIIEETNYTFNRGLDTTETELLSEFLAAVEKATHRKGGSFDKIQWIGHNVIKFDYAYIHYLRKYYKV